MAKKSYDELSIFDMDFEEYKDYLLQEDSKTLTETEIIKNSGKTFDEVKKEMAHFNDYVAYLIHKYKLNLKNKIRFITNICDMIRISTDIKSDTDLYNEFLKEYFPENIKNQQEAELILLLVIIMINNEYMLEVLKKRPFAKLEGNIAQYLEISENTRVFIESLYQIKLWKQSFQELIDNLRNYQIKSRNSHDDSKRIRLITELFGKYFGAKQDSKQFKDNMEYIDSFAFQNEKLRQIYPIAVFQIFVRNKLKIVEKPIMINAKNLLNYKNYAIDNDNGKNFLTYSNYVLLFFELFTCFSEIYKTDVNKGFCMYSFEKLSNLADWFSGYNNEIDIFKYSVRSLVKSTYASYYDEESIFYDKEITIDDYYEYMSKNEDIEEYINKFVADDENISERYYQASMKSREKAGLSVKAVTAKILDSKPDYKQYVSDNDKKFICLCVEGKLQEKVAMRITERIISVIDI